MVITASQITRGISRGVQTEYIVIEEGCLKNFREILRQNKIDGVVAGLFDANTIRAEGMSVPDIDQRIILDADGLHADEKAVEKTLSQLRGDVNVIAAFGSGTITDIARYCAKLKNLTFVSCPTAASVDGFCSSVCAMTFNGTKVTLAAVAPKVVIADLAVIKNAPVKLVKSGFGDILGKYVSLADWKISQLLTGEYYCEDTARLVRDALTSVTDAVKNNVSDGDGFYTQTTYALLLSGLAMQIVGSSRPASGAEHHFSHLVTVAPPSLGIRTDALHGESVGVGTLAVIRRYKAALERLQSPDGFAQELSARLSELHRSGGSLHNIGFYRGNFGELAETLYRENENDCLASVDVSVLKKRWDDVRQVVSDIPSADELEKIFRRLGMKTTLSDIDVDEAKKPLIMGLSPYIRNRLTLNRLLLLIDRI